MNNFEIEISDDVAKVEEAFKGAQRIDSNVAQRPYVVISYNPNDMALVCVSCYGTYEAANDRMTYLQSLMNSLEPIALMDLRHNFISQWPQDRRQESLADFFADPFFIQYKLNIPKIVGSGIFDGPNYEF